MVNERANFSNRENGTGGETLSPNAARQRRKIEAYLLSGGRSDYISAHDVNLSPAHEEKVLDAFGRGQIPVNLERKLLKEIQGPVDQYGSAGVYHGVVRGGHLVRPGIEGEKHEQRILAYTTGVGFDNFAMTSARDVDNFVSRYETPIDFREDAEDFLEMIRKNNSTKKYIEYVGAMENFEKKVYGKKYEYFNGLEALHKEAEERMHRPRAEVVRPVFENSAERELSRNDIRKIGGKALDLFRKNFLSKEERAEEKELLRSLTEREGVNLVKKALFEGDPISLNESPEKRISASRLLEKNLLPKFEVEIENVKFDFSRAFKISGGRDAVICYVKTDDEKPPVARSYYRSNSSGVWRYLPDYEKSPDGGISWYGKGMDEQQLTLPSELQAHLNSVVEESYRGKRPEELSADLETRELFFGTAKRIPNKPMYHLDRYHGKINDALRREVELYPRLELSRDIEEVGPENMDVPSAISPDFSRQVGEYKMSSEMYGEATARVFESNDGRLKWTILEDASGRACVSGIEIKSKLTSTGLRSEWVNAGDYAMPLYEYRSQQKGLGDWNDSRGNYVGMWRNCLSRMPVIRAYKSR
ncbi:hypothetical protein IJ380_01850 [Candidatus Saccharibacteria bacterium]|nr:hypothetical protein [Candidatus Saccharibacteria bacterium]